VFSGLFERLRVMGCEREKVMEMKSQESWVKSCFMVIMKFYYFQFWVFGKIYVNCYKYVVICDVKWKKKEIPYSAEKFRNLSVSILFLCLPLIFLQKQYANFEKMVRNVKHINCLYNHACIAHHSEMILAL